MRHISVVVLLLVSVLPATASVIESTPGGGYWILGSTWVGGTVPGAMDDVLVDGPVETHGAHVCSSISVTTLLGNTVGDNDALTIHGDLTNLGLIRDHVYSLGITLHGDIHNEGVIQNNSISLVGNPVHHLSATPDGIFSTRISLPEFVPELRVVATTPLRFESGEIGLGHGTMTLESGCDLTFRNGSLGDNFGECTVLANGNSIHMSENAHFTGGRIDDAVLGGTFLLSDFTRFTGGLTVAGTLTSRGPFLIEAEVEGLLRNVGVITSGSGDFVLHVRGDLENRGVWTTPRVVVDGVADQTIDFGPGIDVAEFVLSAGFPSAGYQWYRDAVPLPGETASELVLDGVDIADVGVYHCEGAGGELSRLIIVVGPAVSSEVAPAPQGFALAQNLPNPFRPATVFRFRLPAESRARLAVYDVRGREVARLVDDVLPAGEHRHEWRPSDLNAGIYFYVLDAMGQRTARKCTLIR